MEESTIVSFDENKASIDSVMHTALIDGLAIGRAEGMEAVFALLEKGISLEEAKKTLGL